VLLDLLDETVLIKDVPTFYKIERGLKFKIFLAPVLEHIKKMGQPIANRSLKYYSKADQMDVLIGSDPIDPEFSVNMKDLDQNFKSGMHGIDEEYLQGITLNLKLRHLDKPSSPLFVTQQGPDTSVQKSATTGDGPHPDTKGDHK
jgi:hypothetical protein